MEGWHFLRESKTLGYQDGRPVVVGETLTVKGVPVLCEWGLHASKRALGALQHAPGPIVCRVEVGGTIVEGDDKFAGTSRKVLWMADATQTLHEFACWCAERALTREREAGREPDWRSWNAIAVKRAWLRGDATKNDLASARVAAQDVAWHAARATTWEAARSAALAAARGALEAARSAASAARAAAWPATWDAEFEAQNAKLEEMLEGLK